MTKSQIVLKKLVFFLQKLVTPRNFLKFNMKIEKCPRGNSPRSFFRTKSVRNVLQRISWRSEATFLYAMASPSTYPGNIQYTICLTFIRHLLNIVKQNLNMVEENIYSFTLIKRKLCKSESFLCRLFEETFENASVKIYLWYRNNDMTPKTLGDVGWGLGWEHLVNHFVNPFLVKQNLNLFFRFLLSKWNIVFLPIKLCVT